MNEPLAVLPADLVKDTNGTDMAPLAGFFHKQGEVVLFTSSGTHTTQVVNRIQFAHARFPEHVQRLYTLETLMKWAGFS